MIPWNEIQTVLLDLDGTLLDLRFDNFFWEEHLPARYAAQKQLPEAHAAAFLRERIAAERGTLRWYCTDFWSRELDVDIIALKHEIRERIRPREGSAEFLWALQDSGRRVLLVTNAHPDTLTLKLEHVGWHPHFDAIYSSHDTGYPKEDTAFWSALASFEDLDPARTVFFDDNESVLSAAEAFGLRHVVCVTHPDSGRPPNADSRFPGVNSLSDAYVDSHGN